jgi:tripartite-type tricarboxylate transporter receptor subunit TctC
VPYAIIERTIAATFVAIQLFVIPTTAYAQPERSTIRLIVPFNAGGFIDGVARVFADRLQNILGQSVVIDNRLGAGGKVGEDFVANSDPDGTTLLVNVVTRPTLMQAVNPGPPEMDMLKSFAVVGVLAIAPITVNAAPQLGVKDFPSLVAKIKAEPGKHSYGSPGPGSPAHIISQQLVNLFSLNVVHVPYRGGAMALTDLQTGILTWLADTPSVSLQLIQAGKVIPMFVINSTRLKQLPDVPTMTELGLSQLRNEQTTIFLLAPAATPRPLLERLNAAVLQAHNDPLVTSRLDTLVLFQPPPNVSPDAAQALAAEQIEAWNAGVHLAQQQ